MPEQIDQRSKTGTPTVDTLGDATADFAATLADPRRWVIKRNVPIFKAHERTDPATGKLISVDLPKLYRIAHNIQTMERQGGVPVRMTLGHTEPGKPEVQQPPIGGYYRNARIQPFGPKGEPAIVVDEWLDPQYAPQRKNFPYRSSEYYDETEQITGVALLTRDPFLDLGVVAYRKEDAFVAYTKESPGPVHYNKEGKPLTAYRLVMRENTPYAAGAYPAPWKQAQPSPYADGAPPRPRQFTETREHVDPGMEVSEQDIQDALQSGDRGEARRLSEMLNRQRSQASAQRRQQGVRQSASHLTEEGSPTHPHISKTLNETIDRLHSINSPEARAFAKGLEAGDVNYPSYVAADILEEHDPALHGEHAALLRDRLPQRKGQTPPFAQRPEPSGDFPESTRTTIREPRPKWMSDKGDEPVGNARYAETPYSGPWPGPAYKKHEIGHSHQSGGAIYSEGNRMNGRGRAGRYADPGMAGAGMSGDVLQTVYEGLTQAVEALSQLMEGGAGGPGTPPPGPFPEEGGGMGGPPPMGPGGPPPMEEEEPIPASRYAQYAELPRRPQIQQSQQPRRSNYGEPQMSSRGDRRYARYDRAGGITPAAAEPTAANASGNRTISGLPVGYQMKLDSLQYQLQQSNEALRILYYERDQADTEACVSEIRRLAASGFQVGEYEVNELKSKSREERPAYIQHICTKYQRVGTEQPPPMMGDPTPGMSEDSSNRPLNRDEMEQALKIAANSNDPNAFTQAIHYIRNGSTGQVPFGPAFTGNPGYGYAGGGEPEPSMNGFTEPYPGS